MLFSSPSGLWILYGKLLQIFSPQFKEFERTYKCHCEAQSPGDRLGLWKLAVPRWPQIHRVSSWIWGGHRIGSKNSSMSLSFKVWRGECAPLNRKGVLCLWVSTCAQISSSFSSQKENDNFNISKEDIEITLFYGKNKSLNCSFENITRNQDLTTIFCKIKHITAANSIATSSKKVDVSHLTDLPVVSPYLEKFW